MHFFLSVLLVYATTDLDYPMKHTVTGKNVFVIAGALTTL
jgi:hypothetical protein